MKKNTPKLWDVIWAKKEYSPEVINFEIMNSKQSLLWKRMRKEVLEQYRTFRGLNTVELGSGKGILSLLFGLEGANVTLVDYSKEALNKAKLYFKEVRVVVKPVKADILNLPKKMFSKYDISISMGVAEHFSDQNRLKIIKAHLEVLKKGGIAFIIVPNKWHLPYRFHKFLSVSMNRWAFGEEYPFSVLEFNKIGKKFGKKFKFMGGSLFFDPFCFHKRIKKLFGIDKNYKSKKVKKQIGTPLDKYFSHIIIAVVKK